MFIVFVLLFLFFGLCVFVLAKQRRKDQRIKITTQRLKEKKTKLRKLRNRRGS
jgi:hypothetical protein